MVAVVVLWSLVRLASQQSELLQAQRRGSDALQVLSTSRILLLRVQSDESLALIARGTGGDYLADFELMANRLGGKDGRTGLLGEASIIAIHTDSVASVEALTGRFVTLLDAHRQVRDLDSGGHYSEAVSLLLGAEADAVESLDAGLRSQIAIAQRRADADAVQAREGLGVLAVGLPVGLALAAMLVLAGLQRRIGEYR
jgi:hypothetical protein